jgi:hypothetical protein
VFWSNFKHDFKGNIWNHSLEDLQMTLSITAAAKASDNSHLYIGDGADNAPRIQLVFIGHEISLMMWVSWFLQAATTVATRRVSVALDFLVGI